MQRFIMAATMLFVLLTAPSAVAQDATPVATTVAVNPFDLGDGWVSYSPLMFDLDFSATESVPATVIYYQGPRAADVRIVQATVNAINGRDLFDRWASYQEQREEALEPANEAVPGRSAGCPLQESISGLEGLVDLTIGSTICLTEDGQFVWVSIAGSWDANGGSDADRLRYTEASTQLVDLVLETTSSRNATPVASPAA